MAFPDPLQLGFPALPAASCPQPRPPAAGPIGQVLALASVLTVALTAGGHAGEAALGVEDQVVALVSAALEVSFQRDRKSTRLNSSH